jgi:sugar phosphate isomerase/epimerase
MKFGLLTVSYAGLFYDGEALSLEQQIHKARELGFDGLAIETKRPVASPIDLTTADRRRIKEVAEGEGIELCAIESMSNFASRISEERENNLAMTLGVLKLASDLDVRLVKIFAAWPGIVDDEASTALYAPYERGSYYKQLYPADLLRWQRAVSGIREAAAWAEDLGITLLLQNHAPVLRPGYEDALAMMREIDRANVKLCIDAPLFDARQDDEYVRDAVERCGDDLLLSHYGAWNFSESADGEPVQDIAPNIAVRVNYDAFVSALWDIGYSGYLVSEYCLPCIRDHRVAGVEGVEHATKVSLEYMKDVVRRTASVPA